MNQHLSEKERELEQQSRMQQVLRVVAARDLPRGTLLNLNDFAKAEFPAKWITTDAISLSDVQLVQGKQLNTDLKAGQLLMHIHLIDPAQPALASRLGPDKRAVTIPVDVMSSMSGLLQPGDRVDLFVSFEYKGQRTTVALLQGIEVLATGQQTKTSHEPSMAGDSKFSTVTLAASHTEAAKLVAARQGGSITAVLSHETAEPITSNSGGIATQLPAILGLESSKPSASIEIIYGDRLLSEQQFPITQDWAEFSLPSQTKVLP
jgi:pilus assembly protein CpaB